MYIDDRGHQPPLLPYYKPYAVEATSLVLDTGDIFFCGNGPTGVVNVGIERKKIADLAGSIRSDRLAGLQLDGLVEYDIPILLVEGLWRAGRMGELETWSGTSFQPYYAGKQPVLYREMTNFLFSLWLTQGLVWIRTGSPDETAAMTAGMYILMQKDYSEHKAHMGIYAPVPDHPNTLKGHRLQLTKRPKANLVTRMAAQISGIDQRAWAIGEYFPGPLTMCCPLCAATHTEDHRQIAEKSWCEIEGIGKKGAKTIVEALQK